MDEGPPNLPLCKVVQREERVRGRRKENRKGGGGEGKCGERRMRSEGGQGVALREGGRNNEDKEHRVEVEKEGKKKEERIYYGT